MGKNRGANALIGVSGNVAQGNYLAAGISALGATHTNPATLEGLNIVTAVGAGATAGAASGVAGAVTGAATAGVGLVASGIMSGAIGGILEGLVILGKYATETQAVNQAISNLQTQTDVDDQAFKNYLTQSYLNGNLILTAALNAAFPPSILPAQGMSFILGAVVAFGAAWLIE